METSPYEPDVFSAPGGLIQPGSPYVERGETFGELRVRFNVYVLVDDNDEEGLDQLIVTVAGELSDYLIESIEIAPQIDGGVLAGARLILTTEVERSDLFNA